MSENPSTEEEKPKGWEPFEYEGETFYRLVIKNRPAEELRELVQDVLSGQVLPSNRVPPDLMGMVYMPLLFGALHPPKEVLDLLGHGDAPVEPTPPEPPQEPEEAQVAPIPEGPSLLPYDKELEFKGRWGDISEEELTAHRVEIDEKNRQAREAYEAEVAKITADNAAVVRRNRTRRARFKRTMTKYQETVRDWDSKVLTPYREALAVWEARNKKIYEAWASDLGVILGSMKDTFPRSLNGFPMFHTIQYLHKDDWTRVANAAKREFERSKNLEV